MTQTLKPKNGFLIIAAVFWILACIVFCANAAGPATNVVTLSWVQEFQVTPYFAEVHQSTNLVNWIVITNVPSTQTNLSLSIDKDLKAWKVRNVNSTNIALVSDFSNVVGTPWPLPAGNLSIRLGP